MTVHDPSASSRVLDVAHDVPLRPLSWSAEQRLLGVGVKLRCGDDVLVHHGEALAAAEDALFHGARGPVEARVAERLATLRRRLWRAPAWCDRLRAAGLSPNDLRSLGDLAHFPILTRDELAASWTDLTDMDEDPELHVATSSGSGGQALLVLRSGYDGVHMWAVLRFWCRHLKLVLPDRPRLVLLDVLPGGLEYRTSAPPLGRNGSLLRLSTVRPRPLERLIRSRPSILSSDPAGLHWLLGALPDGPSPIHPRLVISSAQHLSAALREAVVERLGAPVVDYYAATETGPIAWRCPRAPDRFHVLHPDVLVESESGRLLVTRLRDSPVPLLRYAIGDAAVTVEDPCPCGAAGPSLSGFSGREVCALAAPGGRTVDAWSLSWLFKDLPLSRFELVQVALESFELTLSPDIPLDPMLLVERLRRVLVRQGYTTPVVCVRRSPVPLVPKPRPFRSLLPVSSLSG